MGQRKFAIMSSNSPKALLAKADLEEKYDFVPIDEAEGIVALGGDGFLLQAMHMTMTRDVPIYGMNRGSVGFLMNEFNPDELWDRIDAANEFVIHPLRMKARQISGYEQEALAICRSKAQEHNLQVKVVRCDYNFTGGRLLVYFSSESRVDFRALVRELARIFRRKIPKLLGKS